MMRALLSVWDKTGLIDLAQGLSDAGVSLLASGGTSAALRDAGIKHDEVADITKSPEMLGGRVKTLHPVIHAGLLADRNDPDHVRDLAENNIEPIDLVVCNLYPFYAEPSIETIDIGGITLLRAAAKNSEFVGVVSDPSQYQQVLDELTAHGSLLPATRRDFARVAFSRTAAYDAAISAWFERGGPDGDHGEETELLPDTLHLVFEKVASVRYGENPHQTGARYRLQGSSPWWDGVTQLAGTALSYLNLFDADAAWRLVHELSADAGGRSAVAIIKHANASGAAVGDTLVDAFNKSLAADPMSAFGGIVAVGGVIDASLASAIADGPQADVIIAEAFDDEAVEILVKRRKATRLLSAPGPEPLERSVRTFGMTALVQNADELLVAPSQWRCVTTKQPTSGQLVDLVLAWRVCARTTSNAIVIANDGVAVGIGAGQQSRVVAAGIATQKAGPLAVGAAAASDAFFPFADGLDSLTSEGVTSVVQPGGSVRDHEVIDAANAAGIVMMMTGERHFRH